MRQMQTALTVVFTLGGVDIVEVVGQTVFFTVLVQVLGRPVQQRSHFDQAVWIDAHRVHLRPHGGVGSTQCREPDLGSSFPQGAGKRL